MSQQSPRGTDSLRARPYGSSLALSVIVVGLVLAILVFGSFLILRDRNDSEAANPTIIPTPSGTSELVAIIPTGDAGGTQSPPTATSALGPVTPTATATSSEASATEAPVDATPEPAVTEPPATSTGVPPTPVEPSSTPEPAPEPTATDVPATGEFGVLPPAQLPSGGVSTTLELDYQLGMSLESLPGSGTVYRVSWPVYTLQDVEAARDRLALQAAVIEEGVGVFRVESDRGTLFVSPTEIVFRGAGFGSGDALPSDDEAITIAFDWISVSGFVPTDTDVGEVVGRDDDLGRVVVKFRPVAPLPNLAPNPAATVTLGPGGTIIEVRIAWPDGLEPADYGLRDPLSIWQSVQAGQGFLEAGITSVFATGLLTGTATVTDFRVAYTLSGSPVAEQYLVPVITFSGTARIDQTGDEIPIDVSVPVVFSQEGTAG